MIGLLALESQQRPQGPLVRASLTRELLDSNGAFLAQDFVLLLAFRVNERPFLGIRACQQEFLIGVEPSSLKHLIRAVARGADCLVGVPVGIARSLRELSIGLSAFLSEALIGTMPFRPGVLTW